MAAQIKDRLIMRLQSRATKTRPALWEVYDVIMEDICATDLTRGAAIAEVQILTDTYSVGAHVNEVKFLHVRASAGITCDGCKKSDARIKLSVDITTDCPTTLYRNYCANCTDTARQLVNAIGTRIIHPNELGR